MKVSMHMMADKLADVCRSGKLTAASKRICIDTVLPFQRGCALEDNVLYVAGEGELEDVVAAGLAKPKVRNTHCYLLAVGNDPRIPSGFPCDYLVAHEGESLISVLVAALRAFREFQAWHDSLADELLGGCDLNVLCQIGTDILRAPIMIYDANYAVIGNSLPEDEASAADYLEKRSSYYVTKLDAMANLAQKRGFQETFKTRGAAVFYDKDDSVKASGDRSLYVNIGRGAAYQGRVVAVYDGEDPRPGDFQIIELFCDAVRTAVRHPSLREGDLDRVFRAYFASMLEGRASDDRLLSDSLRLWNWPRHGRFVCLWAQLSQVAIAAETDAFLCYQLEMGLAGSCAVRYGEGIACVAPVGEGEDPQVVRARFADIVVGMSDAVGTSEEYSDVLQTGEYFTEARVAAGMCAELDLRTCRFGDIALSHYHRHGCSMLPAEHFCDGDVKRLMPFRGQRKDYYAILRCYLEHNMNLLHTSEALFVHRTTLFNYLKEIRAIIEADLDEPEARLRMLASFRIMAQH